jgi:hypothetical protein
MPLHRDHEGRIFYPYNPHTLTDADVHYKGVILRPGAAPIHTFTLNGDHPIRHRWEDFRSQAIEKLKEFDVQCVGLACRQRRQLREVSANPDDSTTIIITVNEMPSMSANKLESLLDDIHVQSGTSFIRCRKKAR